MMILAILVPLALLLSFAALCAFIFSAHNGQFDDLSTPAQRILNEDEPMEVISFNKDPQLKS